MKQSERDPVLDRIFAEYHRRKQLPNFDCVANNRAGRLLKRLDGWIDQEENSKANDYIMALIDRFNEIQDQVDANTNNGNLIKGLIGEQQQILQELEKFILKCLAQRNKEKKKTKKP